MLTGVVIALIAATLLRMSLLRYQMVGRSVNIVKEKRDDQAALAAVMGSWNAVNMTCANPPATTNYTCAPAAAVVPGICGCTCTPIAQTVPPTLPIITTNGTAASCKLTINPTGMGSTIDIQ
jgi:hypothetical protein